MQKLLRINLIAISLVLTPVAPVLAGDAPRILAMGDSMMAAHRISRRAVSHAVGRALGVDVVDRSVLGARIIYNLPISGSLGMKIARQYSSGDWDWIILNGGGNDLWLGCGCTRCARKMDRLANQPGTAGEIPRLLMDLRQTGARVLYVGYLRSPGVDSPIEHCRDDGQELERRLSRFADRVEGIYYLSIAGMVPHGDRSFHGADMIHPSLKGSREIGRRVAEFIRSTGR